VPDNAWNTQPSKTSPCGGGAKPTSSNTVWVAGTTVLITWQIVAADGEGPVTLSLDPTGNTTFKNGVVIGDPTSVTTYNYTYNVPANTVCTGPTKLCTIQLMSSSGWYACASVMVTPQGTPPPPTVPVSSCQLVSGLSFCSALNGHSVVVPTGVDPVALDGTVAATYSANLNNPNVFTTPNATGCAADYRALVCGDQFPFCTQTTVCQATCTAAITECSLTPAEKNLYNCAQGPISCADPNQAAMTATIAPGPTGTAATGTAAVTTPGASNVLLVSAGAIAALVLALL